MPDEKPTIATVLPVQYMRDGFQPTNEAMVMAWLHELRNNGTEDFRFFGGRWHTYDNGIWRRDDSGVVGRSLGGFCRKVGSDLRKPRLRDSVESMRMHSGLERRARDELGMIADDFDKDPDLLATPDGVIDMGDDDDDTPRPHRKEYYITKCAAVSPIEMPTPRWDAFLLRVCAENRDVIAYLYRWFGYCLTGETKEQVFVFFHGFGQNGKGVFLDTIRGIMGSYAASASIELFAKRKTEKHPEELAQLCGVHLVVADETNQGRAWDEAALKHLVSGDTVRAREMRQNSFEYTPRFKICVSGNHKPVIGAVDKAMRRRIHLVPFTVEIPDNERNLHLRDDLKEEWPGILWKLLQGQRDWKRNGLQPPEAVLTATEEYVGEEDSVAQWLAEDTMVDLDVRTPTAVLYQDWQVWAKNAGEPPGSRKAFSQALEAHGLKRYRSGRDRGFKAVRLIPTGPD
jgi:putative DNA primase/helicase